MCAGRRFRHAYGFDDVAIVPGTVTVDPADVDLSWQLGRHRLGLPILASAMDGVVDPPFAQALGRLGGLAVLNLEGLQTRYERPAEQSAARSPRRQPDDRDLTAPGALSGPIARGSGRRSGSARSRPEAYWSAVSATPANAARLGPLAVEAGADIFVVQSTVSTARYRSRDARAWTWCASAPSCRFRSSSATASPSPPRSS